MFRQRHAERAAQPTGSSPGRRSAILLLAALLVVAAGAAGSVAAGSVADQIHACTRDGKDLRYSPDARCKDNERLLTWNIEGPRGEQGPPGPPGESGPARQWFIDKDEDGYGDWYDYTWSYVQPDGYVANNDDCNDLDPRAYPDSGNEPGIPVMMDGTVHMGDMDCDGQRPLPERAQPRYDEDLYDYPHGSCDLDGDGHCIVGWPDGGDDCDDGDPDVFPGNAEVADFEDKDEDCDPGTSHSDGDTCRRGYNPHWEDPRAAPHYKGACLYQYGSTPSR